MFFILCGLFWLLILTFGGQRTAEPCPVVTTRQFLLYMYINLILRNMKEEKKMATMSGTRTGYKDEDIRTVEK